MSIKDYLATTGREVNEPVPVARGRATSPRDRRSPLKPKPWKRYEPVIIGTIAVAVFLAVWQGVASARIVPVLFLPGPTDTGEAFVKLFTDPRNNIWADLGTSGFEFAVGYVSASVFGLALGIGMGWYTRFQYALDPFVNFLYATPRIVLIPLFIIWFGIDWQSKVAVIFLGALFPMIINTMAGVRNTDAALLRVARSFGAPETLVFQRVVLPGAVPFILTGLRLGVGHALTGVVVAELVAARHGIGKLISDYGTTFQTPKMFAAVIFIAGTGVLLTWLLQRIENRFQSWRPQIKT
jgi:ABC-type nitrate/sulfonate/bicarbonate transport system permease component